MISKIEERKALLRLHLESDALHDEREAALAPLRANLDAVRAKAQQEFEAAGGLTLAGMRTRSLDVSTLGKPDPANDEANRRLIDQRSDKEEPAREAVRAAHDAFDARTDALREKIKAAEEAAGGELAENFWTEEGGRAFCAITGLPILSSDETAVVIKAALPAR